MIDKNNRFLGNRAFADGGLYINRSPELVLLGNRFQGNDSFGEGGGAAVNLCFGGEIADTDFVGNEISTEGGGVEGGGLAVYRNGCNDNRARGSDATELTQSGNLFQDNSIDGATSAVGGGEYIEDFRTQSTDDSFVSNQVHGGGQQAPERGITEQGLGGGIFVVGSDFGVFRIEDSTIEGNSASHGSGIASQTIQAGRGQFPLTDLVLQNSIVMNGGPEEDGKFTVRITVRLANGKRITGTRKYHTCIPKLPGDGPPKV